ncbi:MAG: Unknown protein [uncultured Sulfurovum sp.]|uniref:CopG family transcriptional regulator n=1 Tax=uncultured Sulfurovum sp. TaxID=269237 RepID=A0A6S6SSY0_9BACT|nr:MAG: Unknown protein [uncultured Sulfurovum sp.]
MDNHLKIELRQDKIDSLRAYAELLNKDINTMLDEALERYFKVEKERLIEKEESATNLDYDEFWEGVDFED